MTPERPTIYLFAGCNGAGKTTFARAYLTTDYFKTPPRFLNADEIARGLSPLAPESIALKAGKLLLTEIDTCLRDHKTFAIESTLSGHARIEILKHAGSLGYRIEMFYLWIPSSAVAIKRIAQRVKKRRSSDSGPRCRASLFPQPAEFRPHLRAARRLVASVEQHGAPSGVDPFLRACESSPVGRTPLAMKVKAIATTTQTVPPAPTAADERGNAAAKAMSKALLAEHKRWNMPFISWKNGKVVSVKP